MHPTTIVIFAILSCCCILQRTMGEEYGLSLEEAQKLPISGDSAIEMENEDGTKITLNRQKRTLLLKKKLLGAGLLGFGLGALKGYKAGYYTAPRVSHVYLSPPPASVKYVEYVEKPIFVERIIERPAPIHAEYSDAPPYGAW